MDGSMGREGGKDKRRKMSCTNYRCIENWKAKGGRAMKRITIVLEDFAPSMQPVKRPLSSLIFLSAAVQLLVGPESFYKDLPERKNAQKR